MTGRYTLTVIYRTGGTDKATWRKTTPVASLAVAAERKFTIERMGYKALIHRTDELDRIGLPTGWDA